MPRSAPPRRSLSPASSSPPRSTRSSVRRRRPGASPKTNPRANSKNRREFATMATFQVAAGVDASTANSISAVVYRRLYPQVFTGQTTVTNDNGISVEVAWDVRQPPSFDFAPIPNAEALIRSHLLGFDAPPE